MANLLDLMNKTDREQALSNYAKRMRGNTRYRTGKVSPQIYLVAELGYYFGWGAIEAIKRGYVTDYDDDGNIKKILFTMEEACALAEGARKVWYSKLVDEARGTAVGTATAQSKNANSTFNRGMKQYIERARVL